MAAQERAIERMGAAAAEAREIRNRLQREPSWAEGALGHAGAVAAYAHLAEAGDLFAALRIHACQHPAADAITMSKLDEARAAGVRANVCARLPFDVATSAVELCAVIANVLDSAIEVCQALAPDARWIEMSVRTAHGFVAIECRNACLSRVSHAASQRATRNPSATRGAPARHDEAQIRV